MNAAEVALIVSLVLAGLWSGLLLFLTTVLHPVFAGLSGPDFAALMRRSCRSPADLRPTT